MDHAPIAYIPTGGQSELLAHLLDGLVDGTIELPPLPAVAAELSAYLDDPEAEAAGLARLIQRDPVLAGELMRVANSASYAPRNPIVSLQQAIAWLGMAEIQQIAFALCVRGEVFVAVGFERELEALWNQSLAAALYGKELARLKRRNVEVAYLSSLLHRVGRAAAIRAVSRLDAGRVEAVGPAALEDVLDACETPFGVALAARWRLPELVATAISSWRTPSAASVEALETHVAHALAGDALAGADEGSELEIEPAVLEALNLYADELAALRAEADRIRDVVAAL